MSYTTRDVARLLEIPEHEVRAYARAGLVEPERGPRGVYHYTFRDLVLLRTARSLGGANVSHSRIRRALEALRLRLPEDRQLSEVRIRAVESLPGPIGTCYRGERQRFQLPGISE